MIEVRVSRDPMVLNVFRPVIAFKCGCGRKHNFRSMFEAFPLLCDCHRILPRVDLMLKPANTERFLYHRTGL